MSIEKTFRGSVQGAHSRAQLLIRRLWTAVETTEGRRLTIQELSAYLDLSDSALSDWATGKTELNQIEALLKLSERLEQTRSAELFSQHLRVFPTLRSPTLAHDPATVELLRRLLSDSSGLSFIIGGNTTQRTFLFSALGHSYLQEKGASRSVSGWDVHAASWFVPIPGLLYMRDESSHPPALQADAIAHHLILSNGLWERFAQHRAYLTQCAVKHHVIVADALDLHRLRQQLKEVHVPRRIIETGGDAHRLQVTVNTTA